MRSLTHDVRRQLRRNRCRMQADNRQAPTRDTTIPGMSSHAHAGWKHVQDQYFEFLTALNIPHEPLEWDLGPWQNERDMQRELLAPLERPAASIVVATSKDQKDWLPERWAQVVDALWHDFELEPVLDEVLDPLALRVLEGDFGEGDTVEVGAGARGLKFDKQEAVRA